MVERIREMACRYGKPVSAVAVRFILDHLPGSVALCGAKRPDQILGNAQALGWELDKKIWMNWTSFQDDISVWKEM